MKLFVSFVTLLLPVWLFAQCPPGPLGTGNFLDKPSGCATDTLDVLFRPIYNQLDDNAEIHIDWGDGTPETVINVGTTGAQTGISYDSPVPHAYTEGNTQGECVYTITSYVVSACYTIEETTVENDIIIWNTDNFGDNGADIQIEPLLYEVCAGTSATINFDDVSPWNCTDQQLTIASLNDQPRWTQWQYGVYNDITGTVTVDGVDESPYPFDASVIDHVTMPVLNPQAPGNTSLDVFVPATAQSGEEFHVRLNNWNQCNPFADQNGIPTGNDPVSRDAIIRIVDPPEPNLTTTEVGPYCIGEEVQFTYTGNGSNLNYLWDFGDGETSTAQNPTHIFDSEGIFDVTVTVSSGGNALSCTAETSPVYQVTITPTPVPAIAIEDVNGLISAGTYCYEGVTLDLIFKLDSILSSIPDPLQTDLLWNFYERNSFTTVDESFLNPGSEIARSYNVPGSYLIELVSTDQNTGCSLSALDTIIILEPPVAEFTGSQVCEAVRTTFTEIPDNDILIWDWDFSYDGNFNQELRRTNASNFEWYLDGQDITGENEPATSIAGTYMVALRVTSTGNCVDIITQEVVVNPRPDAEIFPTEDQFVCQGEVFSIFNQSVQPPEISGLGNTEYQLILYNTTDLINDTLNFIGDELQWSFEPNADSTVVYQLFLVATSPSPENCQRISDTLSVSVNPAAQADFTDINYDPTGTACSTWESTLQASDETLAQSPDSLIWSIESVQGVLDGYPIVQVAGDSSFGTLPYELTNETSAIQNFLVTLEVYKSEICFSPAEEVFRISPSPGANFTYSEIDSCTFKYFEIRALEQGLSNYTWTYSGNPLDSNIQDDVLQLTYERPAVDDLQVVISLETVNLTGCQSGLATDTINIAAYPGEIFAAFETDNDTVYYPNTTISILNLSSGPIDLFHWEFGDGQVSAVAEPGAINYTEPGTYDIELNVSNSFCNSIASKTVYVIPSEPSVDFTASNIEGCRPLTVSFEDLSEFTDASTYQWDFGDGIGTSTLVNPVYTYYEAGEYTVTLTAANSIGQSDTETKEFLIQVYELPEARFEVRPREVFIPDDKAYFSNFSLGANTYLWDLGDGTVTTDTQPVHSYENVGSYDVSLVATSTEGCSDTLIIKSAVIAREGGNSLTPNAFTPSLSGPSSGHTSTETGYNDLFLPITEGVTNFRMFIYNKWGELLYDSTDKSLGWDGYHRGRLCPADVYVYKLDLEYSDGRKEMKVGDVTLIR